MTARFNADFAGDAVVRSGVSPEPVLQSATGTLWLLNALLGAILFYRPPYRAGTEEMPIRGYHVRYSSRGHF
jgi:hypothetical protein